MNRSPAIVVLALVMLVVVLTAGVGLITAGIGNPPSAAPNGSAQPIGPGATGASSGNGSPQPGSSGQPVSPSPSPTVGRTAIAVVPVTNFRAAATSTTRKDVRAVLDGSSTSYEALELVADEADAILAALDLERPSNGNRLILADDRASLAADLSKNRKRLAFLRADAIGPDVRALAWGNRTLFGVDRVRDLADWPLIAQLPPTADEFDPATTWTIFAGGDIMLDRGVYETLAVKGKGADYPFDGGTAAITGRCKDCSSMGWDLPYTQRTGNAGVVRALIQGADIAMANFENPAPNNPSWHTSGTVFSAEPSFIDGLANAGIDYLSLANNHIRDAGATGLLQTVRNVKKRGIAVSGAGKNLAAARKPAILEAAGVKVAILGYDAIAGYYNATDTVVGNAPLTARNVKQDARAARAAGADLVIVYPHWGAEYQKIPFENQTTLARMIIDNGADMVIGNHAHWAAALEIYKGKPIWYALGNFVFDQTWSEPTMEGITLELTFRGTRLVQIRMRPHIILDKAQPNFMDPATDGKVVMGQVFSASKGLLPW
ncbi:MAG: CapA family protein [Chloroflexi bacterium]|nr:CapA family protein [Chloroflexota bacterium]